MFVKQLKTQLFCLVETWSLTEFGSVEQFVLVTQTSLFESSLQREPTLSTPRVCTLDRQKESFIPLPRRKQPAPLLQEERSRFMRLVRLRKVAEQAGSPISELPASRPSGLCSASVSMLGARTDRGQACLPQVGLKVCLSVSLPLG